MKAKHHRNPATETSEAGLEAETETGNAAEEPDSASTEPVQESSGIADGTDAQDSAPEVSPEEILNDRLLRLQADFDNYRKRIDRERKDWAVFANEKLLNDLLPALDTFDLGLANGEKANAPAALLEGLRLVRTQFETALAKSDVTPIDALGQPFDPNLHEAITHMPSPDVPEGSVIAQTRRGWKMGDKLLRPSQVVVSSGPPA